jgi:ribosomal protein S1
MENEKKFAGRVIFYNKNKGFGAIENKELGSVYLHYTKMLDEYKIAHPDDEVEFEAMPSTRKKGVFEAINVHFIKNVHLEKIKKAMDNHLTLQGKVKDINSGGLLVDLDAIEVFLPKSEVDIYEFNSYRFLLGKVIEFKIIGMDQRSIIASRKQVIEESDNELKRVKISPEDPLRKMAS